MFANKWMEGNAGGAGGSSNTAGTQGGSQGNGDAGTGGGAAAPVFDTWIKGQAPEIQTMLDGHIKGLKSALDSERVSRKDMEKQLRDMAKKAEEGSDAQTKLTEMADQISTADRRASFYEEAHKAGVVNLKLAYLAATQEELFDRQGRVNFDEMKKSYPELFSRMPLTAGNAGAGTGDGQPNAADMNAKIRRASGRQ
jgi:hypothetical protein